MMVATLFKKEQKMKAEKWKMNSSQKIDFMKLHFSLKIYVFSEKNNLRQYYLKWYLRLKWEFFIRIIMGNKIHNGSGKLSVKKCEQKWKKKKKIICQNGISNKFEENIFEKWYLKTFIILFSIQLIILSISSNNNDNKFIFTCTIK